MANNHIPLTLEQHQKILYEILYMVDDFCQAHDIPYFLVGGTLLGAVRYQGIIPWDDDADIAMTRENYERFISLFHAIGCNGYELNDYRHTKGYLLPLARMTKTNTWSEDRFVHKIYIDIFAYDGCYGDYLEQAHTYFLKKRMKVQKYAEKVIYRVPFNVYYDCWKSKIVYFFTSFFKDLLTVFPILYLPIGRILYISKLCSYCSKYSVTETKYSACVVWGIYGKGEVQPSSSFINLDKMRFGDRELPVPSGWHDYLTGIYGDYMTPLPENERHQHLKHGSYLIIP